MFDIKWSSDSEFILCSLGKRNLIQVFSIENPEWKCKIDEGSAGLSQVNWSPDSRHILTTSDFHVSLALLQTYSRSLRLVQSLGQDKRPETGSTKKPQEDRVFIEIMICRSAFPIQRFRSQFRSRHWHNIRW